MPRKPKDQPTETPEVEETTVEVAPEPKPTPEPNPYALLQALLGVMDRQAALRVSETGARKAWATTRYRKARESVDALYPQVGEQFRYDEAAEESTREAQREIDAPLRRKEAARKAADTLKRRREAEKRQLEALAPTETA